MLGFNFLNDLPQKKIDENSDKQREIVKPSKTILEWSAPERMFKTRSREYYRKIAVIILFLAFLLLIIKEFLLIAVLGVVFFAVYIFHTIPPRTVNHKITTNGINYASEYLYRWDQLRSFYIEKKEGVNVLAVNTVASLPGRIFMLLDKKIPPERVSEILNDYVSIDENPEVGIIDKISESISRRINL